MERPSSTPEEPADPKRRRVLGLVFLTLFIDLIGFSILFPLFPDLLSWYLEREGPDGWLGGLVSRLEALVSDRPGAAFAVVALFGGLLGGIYSLLQFLFAPFWGALSDRIGRRPTLLVTLSGTALSYLVWMFAGEFWLLLVARVLGGIMAGNIATASAAVADVSGVRGRSAGMAIVGMAIGLGFVLGPALGALAYHAVDATALWPAGVALGWNPFSGAAALAFLLALWNLIWAVLRFPETRPSLSEAELAERRGERLLAGLIPWRALSRLRLPGVARANLVYLAVQTAFGAMEFTLVFLAAERFGFAPKENAWMFVFIGLVIAMVQGGFVRRRAAAIGEKRLMMCGITMLVPGFLAIGLSTSVPVLYLGLFLLAAGSALFVPTLSALVSLYTPAAKQGLAMGALRGLGSLARAIGPVLGGLVYWGFGSQAPYVAGALFLLIPLAAARKLHQPRTDGAG